MLTRSAPMLRFTPLRRSPLRKVSPRSRARARTWAAVCREVFAACGGRCQVGGPGCTGWAEHGHHKRAKAQGGLDVESNCLAVCRRCHRYLHENPGFAAARGFILQRKDGAAC
jgi:hypothetical protein